MRYVLILSAVFGLLMVMVQATARAEELEPLLPASDPVVKKECGACHMAYRAHWLPADAWRRIMVNLDNHFGENASLTPDLRGKITAYLVAHAGKPGGEVLRITETRWWKRRHSGEVSESQWARAGSPANCAACHGVKQKKGFFESLFGDDDEE
ncbi:MAG: cytochrome C [Alphaproteobacteria bacterium]